MSSRSAKRPFCCERMSAVDFMKNFACFFSLSEQLLLAGIHYFCTFPNLFPRDEQATSRQHQD